MASIVSERIGVAFDMHGCPNRCRHCWLGSGGSRTLSEADVRRGVSRFRDFIGESSTNIREISVSTWFREPDYAEDYRRLCDLEAELGDGEPSRYELLSIWRLARDETYAEWAKSIGPDTCQISFFGMRETNDWFHRRKGAFDDALVATERLLGAGMKPRWQFFLTTKLLPDLEALLALVEERRLRERVKALGDEFRLFLHPPGPDQNARQIEHLRPTADMVASLPDEILASSRRHFGREVLWRTEAELHAEIMDAEGRAGSGDSMPEELWFLVCGNEDVFTNVGTLEPWWRLGNLKRDSVEVLVGRFEADGVLGLEVRSSVSSAELAETHGDATGRKVYSCTEDLLSLYRGKHCEELWSGQ